MRNQAALLRTVSAQVILERAQNLVGSVTHPTRMAYSDLNHLPWDAIDPEIDIDETIEESYPKMRKQHYLLGEDIVVQFREQRPHRIILSIDTSLSMTGEKIALTAIALAVVLLQFPNDPIGIVAFESEATVLKRPDETIGVLQAIERFLDVPAQGYTHLEEGLLTALKLSRSTRSAAKATTVVLSDGKYTAGRDPSYLANRFDQLIMMKMGREQSSLPLCRDLARRGRGQVYEVATLEELPHRMYEVVKDLLRGQTA